MGREKGVYALNSGVTRLVESTTKPHRASILDNFVNAFVSISYYDGFSWWVGIDGGCY